MTYFVYILASKLRVLYTGITRDLERRVYQHRHKMIPGFTCKYNVNQLVYYEMFSNVRTAIPAKNKSSRGGVRRSST